MSKMNCTVLVANRSYPSLKIFPLFPLVTVPAQVYLLERRVFNKRKLVVKRVLSHRCKYLLFKSTVTR